MEIESLKRSYVRDSHFYCCRVAIRFTLICSTHTVFFSLLHQIFALWNNWSSTRLCHCEVVSTCARYTIVAFQQRCNLRLLDKSRQCLQSKIQNWSKHFASLIMQAIYGLDHSRYRKTQATSLLFDTIELLTQQTKSFWANSPTTKMDFSQLSTKYRIMEAVSVPTYQRHASRRQ